MKRGHGFRARSLGVAAACGCFVVPVVADAQSSGMTKAEAAQLYTAAGFPVVNDQPVNRCGKPAKPRVTFVDMNGDKRPEALFVDGDPSCYGFSGRYFALLVKEGATWRQVVHGTGSAQALPNRTAGWLDLRINEPGCVRDHRYDGRTYKAATACGEAAAATAQKAQPAQPSSAPSQAAQPPSSSSATAAAQPPQPSAPEKPAGGKLSAADEAAVFRAAAFKKHGQHWRSECNDPNNAGQVESLGDLNGDGLPEAMVVEGGTMCYGMTGQGFFLVSKLGSGGWKLIVGGTGIPEFLKTKGVGGWPDILVGGPGFCFPVERWNGKQYAVHRWEYEGKPCKRPS